MRTACPECGAAYEVPDRLIGAAGRQLRCAKCGHAWLAHAPAVADPPTTRASGASPPGGSPNATSPNGEWEPPPELPASAPEPAPVSPPTRDVQPWMPVPMLGPRRAAQVIDPPLPQQDDAPPPSVFGLWAAWAASILLVVLAGAALWIFRADLVAAWPPMARLYLALGIAANGG